MGFFVKRSFFHERREEMTVALKLINLSLVEMDLLEDALDDLPIVVVHSSLLRSLLFG